MSQPKTTLRARVSSAILEAAATVLAQHGEHASMADVADAAGMARATVYRYFPNRDALLDALAQLAVQDADQRLRAGRLEQVAIPDAFERAVRALVAVGDPFVVIAHQRTRPIATHFDHHITTPLRQLIQRAQTHGEVRNDLPATWLTEALIGIIVSGLQTRPAPGIDDTVAAITSLFLNGAQHPPT